MAVRAPVLIAGLSLACLLACTSEPAPTADGLSPAAALGRQLFQDPSLSASGQQSCASCHDPAAAHGSPNALAAQLGGPGLDLQGGRLSPTIRYLTANTAFHFAPDGTPTGGFFWDGRADDFAQQAAQPFLNPREMAMPSKAAVIAKVAAGPHAEAFRQVYGQDILADTDAAYLALCQALQRFQLEDPALRPFTSKYDAFLAGKVRLSDAEARGLAVFNDPRRGNCAACHPSGPGAGGAPPLFTDFTYDALGVPRNPELQANADPAYFDLGLAARAQGDLAGREDLYGLFKVPTLRNVAQRKAFFHNGRFKDLRTALDFYATRDTQPERWYPAGPDGAVQKFDDLPPRYRKNVNTTEVPYNRRPGQAPAFSEADIDDLLAFLKTLDDGYAPEGAR